MASVPNLLGEFHQLSFLHALAQELVHDEDCTLLRSCSGRHQCGPYQTITSRLVDRYRYPYYFVKQHHQSLQAVVQYNSTTV